MQHGFIVYLTGTSSLNYQDSSYFLLLLVDGCAFFSFYVPETRTILIEEASYLFLSYLFLYSLGELIHHLVCILSYS